MNSDWSSLEIVKLVVDILTPIVVVLIGVWIRGYFLRLERTQGLRLQVVDKRLDLFNELAPLLNQLAQYYLYVGEFKRMTPVEVIETKRKLDSQLISNLHLLNHPFIESYRQWSDTLFDTYTGKGSDAKLCTAYRSRQELPNWKSEWATMFVPEKRSSKEVILNGYLNVMESMSQGAGGGFRAQDGAHLIALEPKSSQGKNAAERDDKSGVSCAAGDG